MYQTKREEIKNKNNVSNMDNNNSDNNEERSKLMKLRRVKLQKKCKSLKISAEGSKTDIINRIIINNQQTLKNIYNDNNNNNNNNNKLRMEDLKNHDKLTMITTIGDIVKIKNIAIEGMVKFIGPINGKIGIFYGVELNKRYPNIDKTNDGSIRNIYYIPKTRTNKVIFVRKKQIINININHNNNIRITVGDIVTVPKYGCNGVVRFIGYTQFKPNKIWYGVQLENTVGKNNGTIKGHKYFQCEKKKGIFLQSTAIQLMDIDQVHLIYS